MESDQRPSVNPFRKIESGFLVIGVIVNHGEDTPALSREALLTLGIGMVGEGFRKATEIMDDPTKLVLGACILAEAASLRESDPQTYAGVLRAIVASI